MSSLRTIWSCMFSPRLIKIYGNAPSEQIYDPSTLERWSNQVIQSLYMFWKLGVYTSPFLASIFYSRGYFEVEGLLTLTKFMTSVGVILVVSFCCRGLCRAQNEKYRKFITTLESARQNLTPTVKQQLSRFDFDFSAWPVEFATNARDVSTTSAIIPAPDESLLQFGLNIPFRIIAYLAIHTFGIRLIYPGSIGLLQMVLEQSLLQGRSRMIELFHGQRFKLQSSDGNEIDSMFVDRRNTTEKGNILVICSEGNAGFYEIGVTITPIEAGFSVLGWNHPGFGGSTGQPYPNQERNAINLVVQFAIEKLGFKIENIVFFGWSIGGYTSSWAAMNYPECRGLILDATFDDILPLALNQMPGWWGGIVKIAIREHVNLNVKANVVQFPGPVAIIRRTDDEIICLREGELISNRGNNLLMKLLLYRYPMLMDRVHVEILSDFLSLTATPQDDFYVKHGVDESMCQSLLQSYISEYTKSFPMRIGADFNGKQKTQMVLFLARKYLRDYKANHCVNLPAEMFQLPWDLNVEADYVFT